MIKCPYCGKCHYTEDYHMTTCLGWTLVVKDGVRYDENPNTITTYCTCLECGGKFSYNNKSDEVYKISSPEEEKAKKIEADISKCDTQPLTDPKTWEDLYIKPQHEPNTRFVIGDYLKMVCYRSEPFTEEQKQHIFDYFGIKVEDIEEDEKD